MSQERILVADDEPGYLQFIRAVLRAARYEVATVADGEAAVEAAAAQAPTLSVLDVRMPRLDGYAACRRIREFSRCPLLC